MTKIGNEETLNDINERKKKKRKKKKNVRNDRHHERDDEKRRLFTSFKTIYEYFYSFIRLTGTT